MKIVGLIIHCSPDLTRTRIVSNEEEKQEFVRECDLIYVELWEK